MTIRMVYVLYVLPSGLVVWVSLVAAMLEVARSDTAAHVAIRAAVSRHGAVRIPILHISMVMVHHHLVLSMPLPMAPLTLGVFLTCYISSQHWYDRYLFTLPRVIH